MFVVGAGRSGVAAATLLLREGAAVTLCDERPREAVEATLRGAIPPGIAFLPRLPGDDEAAGAGIGFLWYNTYPAQVFMGDTGSLSLGAALGVVAVMVKQEIVLLLVGGVFVMEALSVIFQVFSYKTRRKRIFRMAPIHHHFELKGWAEPKIIVRFWIMSIIFALLAISTLKIR